MGLYGVYGSHSVGACPVNNLENAKKLVLPQSSVVKDCRSPTNKVAYSIFATLQNC